MYSQLHNVTSATLTVNKQRRENLGKPYNIKMLNA